MIRVPGKDDPFWHWFGLNIKPQANCKMCFGRGEVRRVHEPTREQRLAGMERRTTAVMCHCMSGQMPEAIKEYERLQHETHHGKEEPNGQAAECVHDHETA